MIGRGVLICVIHQLVRRWSLPEKFGFPNVFPHQSSDCKIGKSRRFKFLLEQSRSLAQASGLSPGSKFGTESNRSCCVRFVNHGLLLLMLVARLSFKCLMMLLSIPWSTSRALILCLSSMMVSSFFLRLVRIASRPFSIPATLRSCFMSSSLNFELVSSSMFWFSKFSDALPCNESNKSKNVWKDG